MSCSQTAVVIVCDEHGRTLPEAIDSVLTQSAPAQEIVVVDDGSREGLTKQVLAGLDKHEPRLRVVRSKRCGRTRARNLGIATSTAPFVVVLDGEDAFEPGFLQSTSALLRKREDLSFVCCALQAFGGDSYRWKPSTYTVAEALGRSTCGHISTLFRRELWELGGGFDASLPAYEDVDFWLSALRAGHRGVILDEALVRRRVRPGPIGLCALQRGTHSAILGGEHVRAKEALIDKHLDGASSRGEDVFATLLHFERELVKHAGSLRDERARLQWALAETEHEIERARQSLADRGVPTFRWGARHPRSGQEPSTSQKREAVPRRHHEDPTLTYIEQHLRDQALRELCPQRPSQRTLTIRAGDPWPAEAEQAYDLLVLDGALERASDPECMLASARAALRPGGQMIVTAATMALAPGVLRGFTEVSLRTLLCRHFPPEEVRVEGYGNLMTCLGSVAHAPLSALTPLELEILDAAHPTIIAGVGRVPARGRRLPAVRRGAPSTPPHRPPLPAANNSQRHPRRGMILAYRRVAGLHSSDEPSSGLTRPGARGHFTAPELFAAQMQLLSEHYQPLALSELAAQAAAGELPTGAVAVTFDNGYLDALEIASPIADEFAIPVTFFVAGAPPDEPCESWWDTAERILLGPEPLPEVLTLEVGHIRLNMPTGNDRERRQALMALQRHLLASPPEHAKALVVQLGAWSELDLTVRRSQRLMTREELAQLGESSGHDIGVHGLRHPLLPVHQPEVKADELTSSKARLQGLLGIAVDRLAYPHGACNFATARMADELGFALGCTVEPDAVSADSDPLRLPRLEVADEDIESFRMRLEQTIGAPA